MRETLEIGSELLEAITQLSNQAKKEKQISRQVDLNLEIKALEKQLADTSNYI